MKNRRVKNVIFGLGTLSFASISLALSTSWIAVSEDGNVKPSATEVSKSVEELSFNNIEFDFDRYTIRKQEHWELDSLAGVLKNSGYAVKLSGHADSIGEYVYNWKLSKSRSDQVKAFLVQNGVDSSKIASTEFGDTQPIASNKTPEGRRKNRRVEIAIVQ